MDDVHHRLMAEISSWLACRHEMSGPAAQVLRAAARVEGVQPREYCPPGAYFPAQCSTSST